MMKRLIAIALCAASFAARADEWVRTLERPVSGDRVVLNDTTYVLMSVEDFAAFTNKMAFFEAIASKRWTIQHRTEQGRAEWHGNRVSQTFETDDSGRTVKVTEYADGYRHVETAPEKKEKRLDAPKPAPVPRDFIRELRERRANGGAK